MENFEEENHKRRNDDSWHIGKEIPLALLFAIAIQTIGGVWWAASFSATVTAKLEDLSFQIAAISADKYTSRDALKDNALINQKILDLQEQIKDVKLTIHRR